jgi:hypothetical protein
LSYIFPRPFDCAFEIMQAWKAFDAEEEKENEHEMAKSEAERNS